VAESAESPDDEEEAEEYAHAEEAAEAKETAHAAENELEVAILASNLKAQCIPFNIELWF
jgi:hypothetical protein